MIENKNANRYSGICFALFYIAVIYSLKTHYIESVKLLLHKGMDLNTYHGFGLIPLLWVCRHAAQSTNTIKLVRLLLKAGAKLNIRDKLGSTLFSYALSRDSVFYSEVTRLLIHLGSDCNETLDNGLSLLSDAVNRGKIFNIKQLLKGDEYANMYLYFTDAPLYLSAFKKCTSIIKLL